MEDSPFAKDATLYDYSRTFVRDPREVGMELQRPKSPIRKVSVDSVEEFMQTTCKPLVEVTPKRV